MFACMYGEDRVGHDVVDEFFYESVILFRSASRPFFQIFLLLCGKSYEVGEKLNHAVHLVMALHGQCKVECGVPDRGRP